LALEPHHRQQAGSWSRINEDIEVASVLIFATHYASKDARVRHAGFEHKLADGVSILRQNL
jgi:hypothetical protein